MRITHPCKKCIVRPICNQYCHEYENYEINKPSLVVLLNVVALLTFGSIISGLWLIIIHFQPSFHESKIGVFIFMLIGACIGIKLMLYIQNLLERNVENI